MNTSFAKLNVDWNAEPNAPDPIVSVSADTLSLTFLLNSFQYPRFSPDDVGILHFTGCCRYRLGSTNDEGWYLGQCRFSKLAPQWGEFYEVTGDLLLSHPGISWTVLSESKADSRHFLFYLRDSTFECTAQECAFAVAKHAAAEYGHAA